MNTDFTTLAKERRSIRIFQEKKLPEELVVELMKAPLFSPSSKSKRAWEFVLVDSPELLKGLSECKSSGAAFVARAPLAVVVAVDASLSEMWIEDASVATTMLLLQAENLGLGGCWVQVRGRSGADGSDAEQNIRDLLHIPSNYRILSIVAIGYKGQERKPQNEEALLWEKVHTNGF